MFTKEELLIIIDAVREFLIEEEYSMQKESIITKCKNDLKNKED